jgi:threonine dehydratase
MADGAVTNGTHTPSEPQTPKPNHTSLALTEYTANPSPGSSTPREKIRVAGVPEDLLLPNGYPDVSTAKFSIGSIRDESIGRT